MPVHRRVTPSFKFAGTHLYTWVERDAVRVKCLAQEHNTMSLVRARTRTTQSGVELTNHEATAHILVINTYLVHLIKLIAVQVETKLHWTGQS